ncbi:ketopantoate reductase family protein [Hominifimenecus sp. rT4P-3]|uniref:ketopantoate reductase family protein n=1 Tax=Hominifimenecus sp. rT4P-3 TaxID=3242979 RepID=UPI003DA41B90
MKQIRHAALVGLGALGIMYGKQLIDHFGPEALTVMADTKRIRRYQNNGVFANGEPCLFRYCSWEEASEPADVVFFATKYTTFAQAIRQASAIISPDTILISLLNGIVSENDLALQYGDKNLLYCTVQGMDATKTGNGVSYQNLGYVAIGEKDGSHSENLLAVQRFLTSAGLDCRIPEDILHHQWSKMMLNTGINQVTAVYQYTYGEVMSNPELTALTTSAMKEVQAVARPEGVFLADAEIDSWLDLIRGLAPENTTSMCQDIRNHRKTEVDLFGGTTIRLGKKHQIPTPVNDDLVRKIHEIEASW